MTYEEAFKFLDLWRIKQVIYHLAHGRTIENVTTHKFHYCKAHKVAVDWQHLHDCHQFEVQEKDLLSLFNYLCILKQK